MKSKTHSWPDNHWRWPVELSHYHGVKRGGLIFTGGQADLDQHGAVVNPDDLEQQTRHVLQHVESILLDLQATLKDIVKLVIYFTGDASDEDVILDLIAGHLSQATQPVVSTICLPALCYPGMRIELEAVAIDPTLRSSTNPKFRRSNELPALHPQFSHAVQCNDLIFTSDLSAIGSNGKLQASGNVIQQTHIMMASLAKALQLFNIAAVDVLKLNVFYLGDGTAESWTEPAAIRAAFFHDPGPAATGIAVSTFALKGLMTKISVTAAAPSTQSPAIAPEPIRYSWPKGH